MIRALIILSFLIFTSVCLLCYKNPSFIKSLYVEKLVSLKSWGKVEIVEEKPIGSLKDIYYSDAVWLLVERILGFLGGALICIFIGWKLSTYRYIYITDKPIEHLLTECLQRQTIYEKQFNALQLQIVEVERNCLFNHNQKSSRCDSCNETVIVTEDSKQLKPGDVESVETYNKDSQNVNQNDSQNKGSVCREVEEIANQEFDESNFKCILEKLTTILERLSKLSKKKSQDPLENENDNVSRPEQEAEVSNETNTNEEECYGKESIEVENRMDEMEAETIEEENKVDCEPRSDDVDEQHSYSENFCEDTSFDLHPCKSDEKISNLVISIVGAGECEETYRGKIVPVSQIPKYTPEVSQIARKSQIPKVRTARDHDDNRSIPLITRKNTPETLIPERVTPLSTPRKNNSSPMDRSTSRGTRRKQRS